AGLASIYIFASVRASIHALMTGRLARAHAPSEIQNGNSTSSPAANSGSPSETLPAASRAPAHGQSGASRAASGAPATGSSASTASTLPALSWSPMFGNGTSTPRIDAGSTPFFLSQYSVAT